jgi:hypothetical protein
MSKDGGTVSIVRSRKDREHPYVIINRNVFEDERLSWEARGVMGWLLAKPDDWKVRIDYLIRQGPGGRDRMYRIMAELRTYGYAVQTPRKNEQGQFAGWDITIYETPVTPLPEKAEVVNPLPEKPDTAEPDKAEPDTAEPDTAEPDTEKPYALISNKDQPSTNLTKEEGEGAPAPEWDDLTPARELRAERKAAADASRGAARPMHCPSYGRLSNVFRAELTALWKAHSFMVEDHIRRAIGWYWDNHQKEYRTLAEWEDDLRAVVENEIDKRRPLTPAPRPVAAKQTRYIDPAVLRGEHVQ